MSNLLKTRNEAYGQMKALLDLETRSDADYTKLAELKNQIADLDKKIGLENEARSAVAKGETVVEKRAIAAGKGAPSEQEERSAFRKFAVTGDETELRSLNEYSTGEGAGNVPVYLKNQIVGQLAKMSAVRKLPGVVVLQTPSTTDISLIVQDPVATASAEYPSGSVLPTFQPTFDKATLHAYKIGDVIPVSNELMADAATNFESALAVSIGNSFAAKEESWFLLGAGTTEPLGIFNWSNIRSATVTSGSVNATGSALCDALIDLQEAVPAEYHQGAVYVLSTPIIKALKKAKDSQGQYLWSNGNMQTGEPATFNGFPVYRSAALPSTVGAGIHGGFLNPAYVTIGDRGGMMVERDRSAYFKEDATGFRFVKRVDVVVTNPNAVAKLTIN